MEEYKNPIIEVVTPKKSQNDRNDYRIIRLENGVTALLISTRLNNYDNTHNGSTSVSYSATEGPPFMRHGATARAKNLCEEMFFKGNQNQKCSHEKKQQDNENNQSEPMDETEMISAGDDDEIGEEEFEEESELEDSDPQKASCNNVTLDAVIMGYETIPLNVSDVIRSKDELEKLTYGDIRTKSAKNGMVAISFPVGTLWDHKSRIGVADFSRKLAESQCIISADSGYENMLTTFTHLCEIDENVDSCMESLMTAISFVDEEEKYYDLLESFYPSCNSACELKNAVDIDSWMLNDKKQLQLLYCLSVENHPFKAVSPDFHLAMLKHSRDETAYVEFAENLHDNLTNLWRQNYCAHSATIVLQSSESLECLESVALKYLGRKQCHHENTEESQQQSSVLGSPFEMNTFAKLYKINYTGKENLEQSLVITWALSPLLWKNYKNKPMEYVAWLINHKNAGGLYDTLQKCGWIADVQAGCNHTGYHRNDYVSLFQIKIKLNKSTMLTKGSIRAVVKTVFAYLNFLKVMGVQPEIYAALHFSRQIQFNSLESESCDLRNLQIPFSHPASPIPRIAELAEKMQMIPQENLDDLLTMDNFFEYKENNINEFLTILDINTCNFMLASNTFRETLQLEEPYYGTKYSVKDVPTKWKEINEDDIDLSPQFEIPSLYKSIQTSFNDCPLFDDADLNPILVLKNSQVNAWKKSNPFFKKTSAYLVHFASPNKDYSPDRALMISILSKKLSQEVDKVLDTLKILNLRYSIEPSHIGILVKVYGYHSQSIRALEVVLDKYREITASLNPNIENEKPELVDCYETTLAHTESLARCVYNTLSVKNYVSLKSRLNAMGKLTSDSYRQELGLFQQSSTTGMLGLGCCSQIQILELANMKLPENSSKDMEGIQGEVEISSYMWPVEHRLIRVVNPAMENDTVHVVQHFQLQNATPKTKALANILLEIVKNEILKAGYKIAIDAHLNELNNVLDFEIVGSASGLSAKDVTETLDDFQTDVEECIEDSKWDFQTAAKSLSVKRSTGISYHSVINELHEHEKKIKDFSFSFDSIPLEVDNYGTMSYDEFCQWYFANFDEEKRKVTIQIVPKPDHPVINDKNRRSTENLITAETEYTLLKPESDEKYPEKFILDIKLFTGILNIYTTMQ